MNSSSTIQTTLDSFFNDKELSVIVLKGSWGIGKTYFWNNYIREKIKRKELQQIAYSYISLFGLNTLTELKSKIFHTGELLQSTEKVEKELEDSSKKENQVLRVLLGTKSSGENFLRLLGQWSQFSKIIPKVKDFSSLIDLAEYGLIRNYLICLDDIERKEENLSIRQLMGLVDELSKRKNCKVVLILNDKTLSSFDEKEFSKYREKVIDLEVEYKPDIKENLKKVFEEDEIYFAKLLDVFQVLGISNIRIFKKLKWSIGKIWKFIDNCEIGFQKEIVLHLTVFCWAFFNSENELSLSFISNSVKQTTWLSALSTSNKGEELTDNEKEWNQIASILAIYPSGYDEQLVSLLKSGYLDEIGFEEETNKSNQLEQINHTQRKLRKAWDIYSDSFDDNAEDLKSAVRDILKSDLNKIQLWDFSQSVDLLEEYGDNVSEYIDKYIELNRENLTSIDLEDSLFGRQIRNELLREKIQETQAGNRNYTIDSVLEKIVVHQGWNPEDIEFLSSLTEDEICEWMLSKPDRIVSKIRRGLLLFQGLNSHDHDEAQKYRAIADNTSAALASIAKQNSLNRKRVKFIYGIEIQDDE